MLSVFMEWRVVVPLTAWQPQFDVSNWLSGSILGNGLDKPGTAICVFIQKYRCQL